MRLIRTNLGVVIGMSQILLPFMVLPLYAVMAGIDRRLVLASASLGARPLTSFLRIWVPLSLPGVGAGCLMVFISSLGFYVTPALLGSPNNSLISQQIYVQVSSLLQWGKGGAMGVVLLSSRSSCLRCSCWRCAAPPARSSANDPSYQRLLARIAPVASAG